VTVHNALTATAATRTTGTASTSGQDTGAAAAPVAATSAVTAVGARPEKPWKAVLWDLDGVLWAKRPAELAPELVRVLLAAPQDMKLWVKTLGLNTEALVEMHRLNGLGVLQSIVSRNEQAVVRPFLEALQVWRYFRFPQIHDDTATGKSVWALAIAELLNLHPTAFVAIDDQPIERDDLHWNAGMAVADVTEIAAVLHGPRITTGQALTPEARNRPLVYRALENLHHDTATSRAGGGNREQFLASTESKVTLWQAGEGDLARVEELVQRTHQFNTTGVAYSLEELEAFRQSPEHVLLLASLTDRYIQDEHVDGYGTIGVGLISLHEHHDHLRLLLVSCTVETRNIGGLLLTEFARRAYLAGKTALRGDYVEILGPDGRSRNRKMHRTYRVYGWQRIPDDDPRLAGTALDLEDGRRLRVYSQDLAGLSEAPPYPAWLTVTARS
jgi:FkbH-like protein